MSIIIKRLLPLAALLLIQTGSAGAQASRSPSLNLGDAVVTGFSGTVAPANRRRPANTSVADLTFIDTEGASVRVFDVSRPGRIWDGSLLAAGKKFDVAAKDVGQVFGIALDDQTPPNIYVAATSAFGLNIVSRGRDGQPERRKKGGPGAGWMKGQFGLDLQGGPGGIFKIDGTTGVATLFANVTLDGVPNPGPGLGNLAYDSTHKQLFVSDLYTGMIHRFDLDGKELGRYDHGVAGLGAAKLAAVPFSPANRPNIASDRFDSEKPETWGYAPAARRVFGLAVHESRLYYSVVSGPQIWSVGIAPDGSFAADPRWELDVPAQAGPLPISDIAFSHKGAMILAQRALVAGAYDYLAFTRPGEPQVFRVWLKGPKDPPSPGRWKPVPEEYAVGFSGNYRNTNGGVALGYGYGADGAFKASACEFSLWTTGQNLRNAPALKARLDPGGRLVVHGIQGVPASPVRDVNTPPWLSYSVDYDDKFDDPRAVGHLGGVRIYAKPCAAPTAYGGPGYRANAPYTAPSTTTTTVTPADCIISGTCPPPPPGTPTDIGIAKIGENNPDNPDGPYNFTVGVRNLGASITGPQTITFTDVVPAGMTFTNVTSSNWTCNPLPGPPIPAGGTLTCTYTGSFPIASNQPMGWVTIVATGDTGPYQNCATLGQSDSNSSNDQACVTVQTPQEGYLLVQKQVVSHLMGNAIPSANYTVNVTCGGNTTTLSLPGNGAAQAVTNLPYSTQCSVLEPPPPVPPNLCPQGTTGAWTIGSSPSPIPPISGTTTTVTVTNTFDCNPDGNIFTVAKQVTNLTNPVIPTTGLTYTGTVSCVSGMSPAVVTPFSLTDGGSQNINVATGATCTITEDPPTLPSGTCPNGGVPSWQTIVPGPVSMNGSSQTVTIQNILSCKPGDNGQLMVRKVVNTIKPIQVSLANYPVTVTCGSMITNLSLSGDGTPQTVSNIPMPSSCLVSEDTSNLPNVCPSGMTTTWSQLTISPNPVPVSPGPIVTVTVTNTVDCTSGQGDNGTLTVTKVVQNNIGADLTGITYPMTATCSSGGSPGVSNSLTFTGNGMQTIGNLAAGLSCSVTEPTPVTPNAPCAMQGQVPTWTVSIGAAVQIQAGQTSNITVTNTLDCKDGGGGGNTYILVNKVFKNNPGLPLSTLSALTFPATVTCNGVNYPVNLTSSAPQAVTGLPAGVSCSVNEQGPMPALPTTGCPAGQVPTWTLPPNYLPPTSVQTNSNGAGPTLAVQNVIDCKPTDGGTLNVNKVVVNTDPLRLTYSGSFGFSASCVSGMSPAVVTTGTLADGGSQTISNIALGSVCTVSETTMPTASGTCPNPGDVPTWTIGYLPQNTATIGNSPSTVTIQNTLACQKGGGGGGNGSLIVNKTVINDTNGQVSTAGLSYPATATCGGVPTSMTLTESTPGTVSNLTLNTSCSVQEGAYPSVTCPTDYVPSWSTTYLPSQSVPITGPNTPVTVQNTFTCKPIAKVKVTKHVVNNTPAASTSGLTFPMTVSCVTGTMPAVTFPISLLNNGSMTLNNIAQGSTCTASETLPAPPATGCPTDQVPTWVASPSYSPPSVTAASSGLPPEITVTNTLNCVPQPPKPPNPNTCPDGQTYVPGVGCRPTPPNPNTCPDGQTYVPGVGCQPTPPNPNTCPDGQTYVPGVGCRPTPPNPNTCPDGQSYVPGVGCRPKSPPPPPPSSCQPPMVPGAAPGSCVCPTGTHLVQGVGCRADAMPPASSSSSSSSCTPPMVQNAAGPGCVCPTGTTQQGNTCVPSQTQCTPPMIQNSAGPGCVCPTGMTANAGGGCTATSPPVCTPPMVQNAAGPGCVCPPGMTANAGGGCTATPPPVCTPPMVQNAAGPGCVCPTGTTANAGGGCTATPPPVCTPPMVQNAAGPGCVCPTGTTANAGGGCTATPPPVCTPPMIQNAAGPGCVCPAGMTANAGGGCTATPPPVCPPPMIQGAVANVCVCPPGTTQQGNTCVPSQTQCTPPMIPTVAANVCACPAGMVQQGNTCVPPPPAMPLPPPPACTPPMVPGAAPGVCICPSGMTKQGNTCVADKKKDTKTKDKKEKEKDRKKKEPEKKQPNVDLPRGIPGVGFPGLGGRGGSRGSPAGGGGAGGGKGGAGRPY